MKNIHRRSRVVKWSGWLCLVLVLLVLGCAATLAHAQDDDINVLANSYGTFKLIIESVLWSGAYLLLYAAALVIPLIILGRFDGFEPTLLAWIGGLWLGGLFINAGVYAVCGTHRWLVILLALPLLFGWSYLLATRTWADVLPTVALRLSLVVALVCTPYFGPTWHTRPRVKPPVESRLSEPAVLSRTGTSAMPGSGARGFVLREQGYQQSGG
jgi:hypothetical protein